MPRIPPREKLEDPLRKRRMGRVWIEDLTDTERYRDHLNDGGEHREYRVINCRFAQKEQRDRDGRINQSRY